MFKKSYIQILARRVAPKIAFKRLDKSTGKSHFYNCIKFKSK